MFELLGSHGPHDAPRLIKAITRSLLGLLNMRRRRFRAAKFRGGEMHDDTGKVLRERIVNFPCQALTFCKDASLPFHFQKACASLG